MNKIISFVLVLSFLFCLTSCNTKTTTTNSENNPETVEDKKYIEVIDLINSKKYEEAYNKINDIKNKKSAEELKSKFIVIENVLLSKTLIIPDDKLGNKIGPYDINYFYDEKGNLVEIDAKDIPLDYLMYRGTVNPFMKNVFGTNYFPYFEKLTYDNNNRLIKVAGYQKDLEKIIYTADFIYDKNGNNNKVEYTCEYGTVTTLFEYNNNQLIKAYRIPELEGYDTIIIQYDKNGRVLEDGTIYNNKGDIIESKASYYGSNGSIDFKCIWNYGNYYIYKE